MKIGTIHSFLVQPGKGLETPPAIPGATVEHKGQLFAMLKGVFDASEAECQHQIKFQSTNGEARNVCRDAILAYLQFQTEGEGLKIAQRLQSVTTNKSRLGLFFLISGDNGVEKKVLVSRFPADSAIRAEVTSKGLSIDYLEQVFLKGATTYKAAVYSGRSLDTDFWKGRAVDKQINDAENAISNYWIRDFLESEFLTPGEAGTRRFALAVKQAMNTSDDVEIKDEIAAVSRLIKGLSGKVKSAKEILDQFGISEKARQEIQLKFPRQVLLDEPFRFVSDEFSKHVAFRTIELNTGALLTAPSEKFEKVFKQELLDKKSSVVRLVAEGKVVDQRFKKGSQ